MTKIQIAWLVLIAVGSLGIIIALTGVLIHIITKRKNSQCTKQTNGTVVEYGFPGKGMMYPIVEYFLDGTPYRAKKKFSGVITKRISGLPTNVQSNAFEDEKGYLHIKIGPVANLRQVAEQLWPIHSQMIVYYNPNHPQQCYVDRPISQSTLSLILGLTGIVTLIISVLVFFFIQ